MERDDEQKARLRVVDEEAEQDEPVVRLGAVPAAGAQPAAGTDGDAGTDRDAGVRADRRMRRQDPDAESLMDDEKVVLDSEDDWAKSRERRIPYGWFATILVALLLVLGWALNPVARNRAAERQENVREQAGQRIETDQLDAEEAAELVVRIESALQGYLAADSVDEMLPWVRDPQRVEPIMRAWYEEHEFEPREFKRLGVFHPLDLEGRLFWLVSCVLADDTTQPGILVEQMQDGEVKVDWETRVSYQPMEWGRYVNELPEGRDLDFRVYVSPDYDNYHVYQFNEEDWEGYRLATRDSEEFMFGFVERGGELHQWIENSVRRNRGRVSLLLRLRVPEGSLAPRSAEITAVVSPQWAIVSPMGESDGAVEVEGESEEPDEATEPDAESEE